MIDSQQHWILKGDASQLNVERGRRLTRGRGNAAARAGALKHRAFRRRAVREVRVLAFGVRVTRLLRHSELFHEPPRVVQEATTTPWESHTLRQTRRIANLCMRD